MQNKQKKRITGCTRDSFLLYFSTPFYTSSVLHAEADVGTVVETIVVRMEGFRGLERADI